MNPLSVNPLTLLASVVIAFGIGGAVGGYFGNTYGSNSERVKSQTSEIDRKDTTIKALQDAAEDNARKAKKDAADAKQESENHAKELAAVRARAAADAARRVPIDPGKFCSGNATSTTKTTQTGGDGQADAGAAFLPEPFAGDLRQLAADADEVAADLRTLKARVEKAGCFQ